MRATPKFLRLHEKLLADTAGGAEPILRNILPLSTRENVMLGVTFLRVVNIAAGTNIFFHYNHLRGSIGGEEEN